MLIKSLLYITIAFVLGPEHQKTVGEWLPYTTSGGGGDNGNGNGVAAILRPSSPGKRRAGECHGSNRGDDTDGDNSASGSSESKDQKASRELN